MLRDRELLVKDDVGNRQRESPHYPAEPLGAKRKDFWLLLGAAQ
jgi:hypothetical protein